MTLANDIFHVDAKNSGFCGGCSALLKDAIEKLN
jgi:predicted Zn-dependent protease